MGKPKINDRVLLRLIDKEGLSQSKAAKQLGVSRQAVSQRLKELRGKTTRAIVAKKIETVVDQKLDIIGQLSKINRDANEILDTLMQWQRGDEEAIRVLESQVKFITYRDEKGDDQKVGVKEVKFKDPRELALKAMDRIQSQLRLQMDLYATLYSIKEAERFQNIVLEIIGEVDQDVRNEIIRRLNSRRQISNALRFS